MSFKKISLILFLLSFSSGASSLYGASIYTPAAHIALTGSTADVRFDVAGIIFDEETSAI